MIRNYEKHINEKWKRALKYLGINENLFPNKKAEIEAYYPFNEYSIENIRKLMFIHKQLEKMVLEITNIEVVNGCFHTKFKVSNKFCILLLTSIQTLPFL